MTELPLMLKPTADPATFAAVERDRAITLAARAWLALGDDDEIRLYLDPGEGFDLESWPAPDDYSVPDALTAEWHRLDRLRRGR